MMLVRTLATLLMLGALTASVQAQSVMVLRVEPAAEPLCASLESALSGFSVQPDPGYYDEARRRGLDPGSDPALDALTPLLDVDVILVPRQASADTLWLDFRFGRTGQPAGQIEVPLRGGNLQRQGAQLVLQQTRARTDSLSSGDAGSADASLEGRADAELAIDSGDAEPQADAADGGELALELSAGLGVGMRSLQWPEAEGTAEVDVGSYPAAELRMQPHFRVSESVAIGLRLAYTTSIGAEIDEMHVGGTSDPIGIRSHRFAFTLGPELQLGKAFRLDLHAGYASTNLRPNVHHLLTPSYSLAGPVLRLGLQVAIGDSVRLALSPHAQLIVAVGDQLQDLGVEGSGLGYGGEAALGLVLSDSLTALVAFYEGHAGMGASSGESASDVERTFTGRVEGAL